MAKLEMGILGGFSGRVGTVVGYHRRGAWFVRAYQPHIKDRKSAAQLEQRSRFKAMIQFASPATPVLRVGLKQLAAAQQITEGNAFLKINKQHFNSSPKFEEVQANGHFNSSPKLGEVDARSADGGVCPETSLITHSPVAATVLDSKHLNGALRINYPQLRFSQGNLPAPRALQWSVDERGALSVRWSGEGGRLTNRVHIYVYCPSAATGISADGERGRGGVQLLLPQGFASEELHVWAFASSKDGNVSGTVYGASDQFESDGGASVGIGQRTEAPVQAEEGVSHHPSAHLRATQPTLPHHSMTAKSCVFFLINFPYNFCKDVEQSAAFFESGFVKFAITLKGHAIGIIEPVVKLIEVYIYMIKIVT